MQCDAHLCDPGVVGTPALMGNHITDHACSKHERGRVRRNQARDEAAPQRVNLLWIPPWWVTPPCTAEAWVLQPRGHLGPALPKSYVPQQLRLCLTWGGHLVLLECILFHGEKTQPLPSRGSWSAGETDTHHSDCKSFPAAQVLAFRGYLFILDSSVSSGPLRNIYKSPVGIKISVLLLA